VVTRDNGLRRIYWIGRRTLGLADFEEARELQPILVRSGAFGDGRPSRDMWVSPRHRFLLDRETDPVSGIADREEVLISARDLEDGRRIQWARALGVSYIHILCDRHQVILANGAWTESFHPDDETFAALAQSQQSELMQLFPDIETIGASTRFRPARLIIDQRSRFER